MLPPNAAAAVISRHPALIIIGKIIGFEKFLVLVENSAVVLIMENSAVVLLIENGAVVLLMEPIQDSAISPDSS